MELPGNPPTWKISVFFGKYITAVGWTALAGWAGLTASVLTAQPDRAVHLWSVMAVLVLLSSLAYGALFAFIGVAIHKHPMVAAVAYALIIEFVVGMVPAMINQLTVHFRLRTLLFEWTEWQQSDTQEAMLFLVGTAPAWKHVLILLGFTGLLLVAAVWMIRDKTLVSAGDG